MSLMQNHSRSCAIVSKLKPLFVGIVQVDKCPNVIAVKEIEFLFVLFEVCSGARRESSAAGRFSIISPERVFRWRFF